MQYPKGTVKSLIEMASRRGNIPDSQMNYVLGDFLDTAYEELISFALPVLHARRDDYYLSELNFSLDTPDTYIGDSQLSQVKHPAWRLPDWVMANTVRDVQGISPGGTFFQLGRITPDDVPNFVAQGWYFYGDYIVYQQNTIRSATPPIGLRVIVHTRPNRLITHTETMAQLGVQAGVEYPFSQAVKVWNIQSPTVFDVTPGYDAWATVPVQGVDNITNRNGYEVKNRNLVLGAYGNALGTVTLASTPTVPVEVGDWFCLTGYTPVVPLPDELHPLLAQRIVVKFLEAQGDEGQLGQARESLSEMTRQVPLLLQPRAEGKPKKIAPRMGLWRRWRW